MRLEPVWVGLDESLKTDPERERELPVPDGDRLEPNVL